MKILALDVCEHHSAHVDHRGPMFAAGPGNVTEMECGTCGHVCRVIELDLGEDPAVELEFAMECIEEADGGPEDSCYAEEIVLFRKAAAALRGETDETQR